MLTGDKTTSRGGSGNEWLCRALEHARCQGRAVGCPRPWTFGLRGFPDRHLERGGAARVQALDVTGWCIGRMSRAAGGYTRGRADDPLRLPSQTMKRSAIDRAIRIVDQ